MRASKQYGDDLHLELEQLAGDLESVLDRKCVDKYCHKKTIESFA